MKAQIIRYSYTDSENDGIRSRQWEATQTALVIPGGSSDGPHTLIVPKGRKMVFLNFFPPRSSIFEDEIGFISYPFGTPLPRKDYEVVKEVEVSDDFVKTARDAAKVFTTLGILESMCQKLLE